MQLIPAVLVACDDEVEWKESILEFAEFHKDALPRYHEIDAELAGGMVKQVEDGLSALSVLSVHRDVSLDLTEVVDKFARERDRRANFFHRDLVKAVDM